MRGEWEERGSDRGRRAFKTQSRAFFRSFQSDVSSLPDNHFSSLADSPACLSLSLRLLFEGVSHAALKLRRFITGALLSLKLLFDPGFLKSHKYVLVFFWLRELRSIYLVLHMLMQICVSVSVPVWGWGSCLQTYSMWIHNAVMLLRLCVCALKQCHVRTVHAMLMCVCVCVCVCVCFRGSAVPGVCAFLLF